MTAVLNPSDLISEADVYKRYPDLFADRELREARQRGQIAFFNLRKGVYYSPEQIAAYLNSKVTMKCKNATLNEDGTKGQDAEAPEKSPGYSSSETSGSTTPTQKARSSTIVGMTPDLEKRAAARLE